MPVPDFSPGEVLTAAAMDSIGLWLVTTYAIPSSPAVASFTISNCFSADYENYKIVLDTTFSTSGARMTMRPASVTTNYDGTFIFMNNGSGTINGATTGFSDRFDIGLNQAGKANAEVIMYNPSKAGVGKQMHSTLTTTFYYTTAFGRTTTTTASTGLYVEVQTGTMSGGTVRIYGMRN